MSVINKMLRDLDQRQAANRAASSVPVAQPQTALRRGTASVSPSAVPAASGARPVGWLVGLGSVAALAVAGYWWQTAGTPAPRAPAVAVAPASAAVVAPVPVSAASVPVAAPEVVPVAVAPVSQAPTQASAPAVQAPPAARPLAALAPAAVDTPPAVARAKVVPAAAPATPAAPIALRMESALTPRKGVGSAPSAPAAVAPAATAPESVPVAQRQQQAGGDAIAQAQSLWNTGSRDAAIDLMQQSVAAAERAAKTGAHPGSAAGGTPLLLLLVREMARMQMAEARFGAVWEGLTRLEPLLGNQPDLWAIRANAAQRLGRHQDSVHAYMMALQSRPNEQRWMLGAAVSLAALGQTNSAADMAERARAAGPISRDVLAYLRQMGVPVKE